VHPPDAGSGQLLSNPLDSENKKGTLFPFCSNGENDVMVRAVVEEAAALASLALFIGMIAIWAQVVAVQ